MVLLVGVIGPVRMVWAEKLHCSKHMCKHQKLSDVCPTANHDNFYLVKASSCCPDRKIGLVFLTESQRLGSGAKNPSNMNEFSIQEK